MAWDGKVASAGSGKIAATRPLIKGRRHSPQIAVAGEGAQHQAADAAEDAHGARMEGHPGEAGETVAGAALAAGPLEGAVFESFLPAQMQKDARDVDLHGADVAACAT